MEENREIGQAFINDLFSKNVLRHGGEWEEHKYVAKVPLGMENGKQKYRYFYDKKEYQDYIKSESFLNTKNNITIELPNPHTKGTSAYNKFEEIKYAMNDYKSFDELKLKDKNFTKDEDQALVNKKYKKFDELYTHNCSLCSAAYDMRRRGYDVVADGYIPYGEAATRPIEIMSWYNGAKLHIASNEISDIVSYNVLGKRTVSSDGLESVNTKLSKGQVGEIMTNMGAIALFGNNKEFMSDLRDAEAELEKELKQHGDGARGILIIEWDDVFNSAHAVNWEIENGKLIIRDCQTNDVYTTETTSYENGDIKYSYSGIQMLLATANNTSYIRTDNLEPTKKILSRIKNRE